jgi:hypothetical protein
MISGPKKGFYYYLMFSLAVIGLIPMMTAVANAKGLILNWTVFENITHSVNTFSIIILEFYFISEIFKYGEGYTTVTTTEYNLYKCREETKEESFMMFADSEEELEQYFEISHPDKKFFIEPAELSGKSISMKVFNQPTNE